MTTPYQFVLASMQKLSQQYSVITLGTIGQKYPFFVIETKAQKNGQPIILLTAGIHGDEPAGVIALLNFIEQEIPLYLNDFQFIIFPCINPYGFDHNQRKNKNGIDLNRNFSVSKPEKEVKLLKAFLEGKKVSFQCVVEFHEDNCSIPEEGFSLDDSPHDFYLYEFMQSKKNSLGKSIIHSLRTEKVPIYSKSDVYGERAEQGLILFDATAQSHFSGTFDQMIRKYTSQILTPETPTCWDLTTRVNTQQLFLRTVLSLLKHKLL